MNLAALSLIFCSFYFQETKLTVIKQNKRIISACTHPDVMSVPGVTILLSLVVVALLVAQVLPQTSDAIPLIGQPACLPSLTLNRYI